MASISVRMFGKLRFLWRDIVALLYAMRDPAAPWTAKLVAILALVYAISPVDLIPDVIPFVGLLDDLVLVPLGMTLAFRLLPPAVVETARAKARVRVSRLKRMVWLVFIAGVLLVLWMLWPLSRTG